MQIFLIISCAIFLASARPDVSLGYKYHPVGKNNYPGSVSFSHGGSASVVQQSNHFQQNSGGFFQTNGFQQSSGSSSSGAGKSKYVQKDNVVPVISKHFYIHAAPDEEEEDVLEKTIIIGQPQKSYRVIFIKAPSQSNTKAIINAVYPKNEEKTVIYVLAKKGGSLEFNDIATPEPPQLSKPEVFFIKYKTKEEAIHAQQQIQAQYDALGGASHVSDEGIAPITSVIGSISESSSSSGSNSGSISGSISDSSSSSSSGKYDLPSGIIDNSSNNAVEDSNESNHGYLPPKKFKFIK